jgi:hypothetical protein
MKPINNNLIKKGLEELMEFRTQQVEMGSGSFTLYHAIENYQQTEQIAIRFGVEVSKYNKRIDLHLNKLGMRRLA